MCVAALTYVHLSVDGGFPFLDARASIRDGHRVSIDGRRVRSTEDRDICALPYGSLYALSSVSHDLSGIEPANSVTMFQGLCAVSPALYYRLARSLMAGTFYFAVPPISNEMADQEHRLLSRCCGVLDWRYRGSCRRPVSRRLHSSGPINYLTPLFTALVDTSRNDGSRRIIFSDATVKKNNLASVVHRLQTSRKYGR